MIRIVMNGKSGVARGIRFETAEGAEIENVLSCDIKMRPQQVITATLEIQLDTDGSTLQDLMPMLGVQSLAQAAAQVDCSVVTNKDLGEMAAEVHRLRLIEARVLEQQKEADQNDS